MAILTDTPSLSYGWYQRVVNTLPGMSSRHIPRHVSPVYDDIRLLGALLGRVIAKPRHEHCIEGPGLFLLIENLRRAAKNARLKGNGAQSGRIIQQALEEGLSAFPAHQHDECLRKTVGGFRLFLELAALTENYHAKHTKASASADMVQAISESLSVPKAVVAERLSQTSLRFVSTAHPTQVYRDTYLSHEHDLLNQLSQFHLATDALAAEQWIDALEATIETLWLTRFERWDSPSVFDEAQGLLPYLKNILHELPAITQSIQRYCPQGEFLVTAPIQVASWIGGDMDGNPNTNAETLSRILETRYQTLLAFYEAQLLALAPHYSYSHLTAFELPQPFAHAINTTLKKVSALPESQRPGYYSKIHQFQHREPIRQWLLMLAATIHQRQQHSWHGATSEAYSAQQFADDIALALSVLKHNSIHPAAYASLNTLHQQVVMFGFHWVGIDLREEAANVQQAVNDWVADPKAPDVASPQRMGWLLEHLTAPDVPPCHIGSSQVLSYRLMGMLQLAAQAQQKLSNTVAQHLLLSMTHYSHDIIAALVLARWCGLPVVTGNQPVSSAIEPQSPIAVVPLFETIDDLRRCQSIMTELFAQPEYRNHCQNKQVVLMAYSDSNKDGGFCTSQWELYQAQAGLFSLAETQGITLQFYHGRGGSIGRGGGPTQRFIQALPEGTQRYGMHITEQGEVLTHHYLSGSSTRYHWQQYLSAILQSGLGDIDKDMPEGWLGTMDAFSEHAYQAYIHLKQHPGFIPYFEQATPKEIDSIHIGSRPSHRRNVQTLSDLRAIPWVFRWYQSRVMLPGWYGMGSAIGAMSKNEEQRKRLQELYQEWPFFTSLVDNCATTLLQTDTNLMQSYAQLAEPTAERDAILKLLLEEYQRSVVGVLAITQCDSLLGNHGTASIRASFEMKQAYLDPLNYLQVHLLEVYRDPATPEARKAIIHRSLISAVGGVVAGLGVAG